MTKPAPPHDPRLKIQIIHYLRDLSSRVGYSCTHPVYSALHVERSLTNDRESPRIHCYRQSFSNISHFRPTPTSGVPRVEKLVHFLLSPPAWCDRDYGIDVSLFELTWIYWVPGGSSHIIQSMSWFILLNVTGVSQIQLQDQSPGLPVKLDRWLYNTEEQRRPIQTNDSFEYFLDETQDTTPHTIRLHGPQIQY